MAEGGASLSYVDGMRVGGPLNLFLISLWASLSLQSLDPKYNPMVDGCVHSSIKSEEPAPKGRHKNGGIFPIKSQDTI
jgi:hypothetical protein